MIQVFSEVHEVLMFCDLHGHSTKRNVFMYGCSLKSYDSSDKRKNLLARMVPILMSKNSLFSYDDSRFKMEKCKESTARIVVFKQFKIINSYTMEASFYGPSKIEAFQDMRTDFHMEQKHYESLGHELALVCLNFVSLKVFVKKLVYISTLLKEIDNQRSDFSKNVVVSFFGPEKSEILDVTDDDFEDITGLECSFKTQIFEKEEIWQDITFEDIYVSDTDSVISSVSAAEEFEFEITIKRKNPPKKQKIQMIDQTLPPRPKKEHVAPLSKRRVYRYENPKTEQEKSNNHIYATNGYVLKFNFNEDKSSRSHSTENIFKDNLRKPGRLAALSLFKNASPIQADHLQGTGLMHLLRKTQEKVSETVLEPHGIEIRNKSHEIYNSTVRRTVFSKSPQSFSEINQSSHRILANTTEDNQKKSKPRPSNSDNPRGGDLVKSFQKARLRLMMNSRSKKD